MVTLQVAFAAIALSGVSQTVLLDFYSDSCGPCREMNPTVQALINAGYPVQRVNITKNPSLAMKFGVRSIPCFVMIVNGREVDREVGKTSMGRLREMCQAGAAARPERAPPMLAMNGAPPAQPIPPLSSLPPSSTSPPPSFDPWGPAATAAIPPTPPTPLPLKAPTTGVSDAALLAASVRLRVQDPDGRSCGSGTIIDSRGDEALVLTCGHIFRDSQGKGQITVDLFGVGEPKQVAGRLLSFDLNRDVGIVAIRTPGPVAVARLAPPGYRVTKGMPVVTIGCNQGEPPTVQHSQVNSVDESQERSSLWVAGQPVEGRSGGGLFSREGYVIGVCNAADPNSKEGYFAAAGSICAELDRDELAFVYKSPSGSLGGASSEASPSTRTMPGPIAGTADMIASSSPPPMPGPAVMPATAIEPIGNLPLPAHEQAALDEIRRREKEGAKVIIVVCPRGNPDGRGDVIVVDHASQGFVKQLASEGRRQDGRYPTSLELPNPPKNLSGPRKVILEWSLPPGAPVPNPASSGTP